MCKARLEKIENLFKIMSSQNDYCRIFANCEKNILLSIELEKWAATETKEHSSHKPSKPYSGLKSIRYASDSVINFIREVHWFQF